MYAPIQFLAVFFEDIGKRNEYYLERAIFKNIAPFGYLDLTFNRNDIMIFSGLNGKGKTAVLSYIADAFFEIAKGRYTDVLIDSSKYYRVMSRSDIKNSADFGIVYLRFKYEEKNVDYISVIGDMKKEVYEDLIKIKDKINFDSFLSTASVFSCSFKDIKYSPGNRYFSSFSRNSGMLFKNDSKFPSFLSHHYWPTMQGHPVVQLVTQKDH